MTTNPCSGQVIKTGIEFLTLASSAYQTAMSPAAVKCRVHGELSIELRQQKRKTVNYSKDEYDVDVDVHSPFKTLRYV